MKKIFENLAECVEEIIKNDLEKNRKVETIKLFIKAYNKYLDEENLDCGNGRGKIYDIDDKQDLMKAISLGLTSNDIVQIKLDNMNLICHIRDSNVFLPISLISAMSIIRKSLDDFVEKILLYSIYCDEYKPIFERYFIELIEESN